MQLKEESAGWWNSLQPSSKCQTRLASASRRHNSAWSLSTTATRSPTPGESPELSAGARMSLEDMCGLPMSSCVAAERWIHKHTLENRMDIMDREWGGICFFISTFQLNSLVCTHTNVIFLLKPFDCLSVNRTFSHFEENI